MHMIYIKMQDNGSAFVPSGVSVTKIVWKSMLQDIIVEELARRSIERPSCNQVIN